MAVRVRLKTKLVLAISGMVVAVVATLSTIYVSHTVRHAIDDAYADADFVGHQIFHLTRDALEKDLSDSKVNLDNPNAVLAEVALALEDDPGLNSLLQSIIGYSPTIYDVAIVDAKDRALLHTDSDQQNKVLPPRESFSAVRDGGFRR